MKSSTTPSFWREYRALDPAIQKEARKPYQLWQANPRHPSLHYERKGDYWSVRITRGWRALARDMSMSGCLKIGEELASFRSTGNR